ncbi:MAG: hypothetical protein ACREB1_05940 [Sphingomicrobium sp.]
MTRTLILAATAAAGLAVATTPANAQRWNDYGWRTIAYKTVNGRDTDTIDVRGNYRQRAVRLCAMNAPIRLRDVDIRFENGRTQDANTRARLGAGRCTRAIDLRGNRRDIDWIRLRYEPIARGWRRPLVRVQIR